MTKKDIIKELKREIRAIVKENPEILDGYQSVDRMDGEMAHSLGYHSAYSNVLAMLT